MQAKTETTGGSGLKYQLHPLVLINISDHHTRTKLNADAASTSTSFIVMGCLLGEQKGRVVDISNSFELKLDGEAVNDDFLQKKMEQYKQTFPQLDVVGWYTTGQQPTESHMVTQKKMMEINESPVFLLLDADPKTAGGDLPVTLYESEIHVLEGVPTTIFAKSTYTIATSEAERIGVDQVVKILPTGATNACVQLSSHMGGIQGAVQMLVTRIQSLYDLLNKMHTGDIPFNHNIARKIAALAARLPASEDETNSSLTTENWDALLTVLLTGLTKGTILANEVVEKHNVAYERLAGKRSVRGGPPTSLL